MDINLIEGITKLVHSNPKSVGSEVNIHTNLVNDLGFDSIDLMTLVTDIENEFDIAFGIDDLDYEKIVVIKDLYEIVKAKQ